MRWLILEVSAPALPAPLIFLRLLNHCFEIITEFCYIYMHTIAGCGLGPRVVCRGSCNFSAVMQINFIRDCSNGYITRSINSSETQFYPLLVLYDTESVSMNLLYHLRIDVL